MGAMATPLVQKGGAMLSFGQAFAKSDISASWSKENMARSTSSDALLW